MSNNWRDREPTDKQLRFINNLGYTYKVPSTRGEASDIINTLKKKKIRMDGQLPANDFVIQTALVRITFDEKKISLAQEKVNRYLSDGFRIDRIWEYGNDHWDSKGKVFVLTRGGCTWKDKDVRPKPDAVIPFAEIAFIRVSFDELHSEYPTTIASLDLAQVKINMYLSDGFEFWFTEPVFVDGFQIGRIVWLGKTRLEKSEKNMQRKNPPASQHQSTWNCEEIMQ